MTPTLSRSSSQSLPLTSLRTLRASGNALAFLPQQMPVTSVGSDVLWHTPQCGPGTCPDAAQQPQPTSPFRIEDPAVLRGAPSGLRPCVSADADLRGRHAALCGLRITGIGANGLAARDRMRQARHVLSTARTLDAFGQTRAGLWDQVSGSGPAHLRQAAATAPHLGRHVEEALAWAARLGQQALTEARALTSNVSKHHRGPSTWVTVPAAKVVGASGSRPSMHVLLHVASFFDLEDVVHDHTEQRRAWLVWAVPADLAKWLDDSGTAQPLGARHRAPGELDAVRLAVQAHASAPDQTTSGLLEAAREAHAPT